MGARMTAPNMAAVEATIARLWPHCTARRIGSVVHRDLSTVQRIANRLGLPDRTDPVDAVIIAWWGKETTAAIGARVGISGSAVRARVGIGTGSDRPRGREGGARCVMLCGHGTSKS